MSTKPENGDTSFEAGYRAGLQAAAGVCEDEARAYRAVQDTAHLPTDKVYRMGQKDAALFLASQILTLQPPAAPVDGGAEPVAWGPSKPSHGTLDWERIRTARTAYFDMPLYTRPAAQGAGEAVTWAKTRQIVLERIVGIDCTHIDRAHAIADEIVRALRAAADAQGGDR